MLLKLFSYVPLLQCLTFFSLETHKTAAKKFLVLLVLSTLPVIVAAFLSPIPDGDLDVLDKLVQKLHDAVSVSELFVYVAAFLTPILYVIFEKYAEYPRDELAERIKAGLFKGVFQGYGLVTMLAFIVMLGTAIAFSSIKIGADAFKLTFLNYYLMKYSGWVFLFSLYCWYLTLLDAASSSGDFVGTNRQSENDTAQAFAQRVHDRGGNND